MLNFYGMRKLSALFNRIAANPLEELQVGLQSGIHKLFPTVDSLFNVFKLESPPSHIQADFSFSTFPLASLLGRNPTMIASQIIEYFSRDPFLFMERLFAVGPYVNIALNKNAFNKQALRHLFKEGINFGSKKNKNRMPIIINYHVADFLEPLSIDGLRQLLIGRVVGLCHQRLDNIVLHNYYLANWNANALGFLFTLQKWPDQVNKSDDPFKILRDSNDFLQAEISNTKEVKALLKIFFRSLEAGDKVFVRSFQKWNDILLRQLKDFHRTLGVSLSSYSAESDFIELSKNIVSDALTKGIASDLPHTEAVITLPFENDGSLVLQKHDGSSTYLSRHLASLKDLMVKIHPAEIINIYTDNSAELADEILHTIKRLNYSNEDVKISSLVINRSQENIQYPMTDKALHYALLRMPTNRKIIINDENKACYIRLARLVNSAEEGSSDNNEDDIFNIIKRLLVLPTILAEVRKNHAPNLLCNYLEEILEQYEKLPNHNHQLIGAVKIVIKSGLNILSL